MKHLCILFFFLILSAAISAQTTITGSVKNRGGEPLIVNVLIQAQGSVAIAGFATTNADGAYTLTHRIETDSVILTVTGMNVGRHIKTVSNQARQVDFEIDETPLDIAQITVAPTPIRQTGDTITYLVDAYRDQSDRVIGDVLRKLPGIEVSSLGSISYMGRTINKFYIEGLDMLQGRYGLAVRNISAADVAAVEVLENHQPIRALRNRVFSPDAAINLRLRDSAKGTLSISGMAGAGYQPAMWNAELVSMYFAQTMQHMTTYKGNNTGNDVAAEFRRHYDYERVSIGSGSLLHVQSPGAPPVAQKRFLYNNAHTATVNQLFKLNEDTQFTINALYYNDHIRRSGYSRFEQYLPGDSILSIEERVTTRSKINNLDLALRLNTNAENFYMNHLFNLHSGWNSDTGRGETRSNANNFDETVSQTLDRPSFTSDYTLNMVKTTQNNVYNIHFSVGYGERSHSLNVSPADYFGNRQSSMTQDMFLRNLASVLRVTYGLRLGAFTLDYGVWARADVQNMKTELQVEENVTAIPDSLKNNLWFNNYRGGINQRYVYLKHKWRLTLELPLVYDIQTADDRIPERFAQNANVLINPSFTARHEFNHEWTLTTNTGFNRAFGGMNDAYTGYIMHGFRSLQRNTVEHQFETRSANVGTNIGYRNVFEAIFINAGINYRYGWRNMLHGYDYQGITSIRNTLDRPTTSDGISANFRISKGFSFWRMTPSFSCNYSQSRSQRLLQDEILRHRSQGYGFSSGITSNPSRKLGVNYSLSWNQNRSYALEQSTPFPAITGISQDAQINYFPTQQITINFRTEHRYNSIASSRHTAFSDAGVKFKRNRLDMEMEINNIFNTKQYVSASYSDISAYYTTYELRPLSVIVSARFKLK